MSDSYLIGRIDANKAKKAKYQRVINSISSNGLSTMRSLESLDNYIKHCEETIEYIDSDIGYHYLANFRNKLEEDLKKLKEYRNFAKDSNTAFMSLHARLEAAIVGLDAAISSDRAAYNKGKPIWEQLWW
ncbi:hypothetical protein [Streptococcus cristatus]|uniref:LXG domain-containing protein n=1 Tax=Streptococcus cristatus TaxID=45634 RepID=A0A139N5S9_STRCR|nr:hypothetical protein [Streptococcus cristatus]KXT71283.1 hypothetical protein SCRDD08_00123 [Streptococcus cristatus]